MRLETTTATQVEKAGIREALLAEKLAALPTVFPGTLVAVTTTSALALQQLTTITGWGFAVGVRQNFQRILMKIRAADPANPPTAIYCEIRANDAAGELLGSLTQAMNVPLPAVDFRVNLTFPAPIVNAAADKLWIAYKCNAPIRAFTSPTSAFPVAGGHAATKYSESTDITVKTWPSAGSSQVSNYVEFYTGAGAAAYALDDPTDDRHRRAWARPGFLPVAGLGLPAGGPSSSTSTFSGWGQYVGNIAAPFNMVRIPIYPFDAALLPTEVIARVRRMPASTAEWQTPAVNWEILAESTVLKLGTLTEDTPVTVEFLLNANVSGHCWVEFLTDGHCSPLNATGTPVYPYKQQYSTSKDLHLARSMQFTTSPKTFAIEFGLADWSVSVLPVSEVGGGEPTVLTPSVELHLPTDAQNAIRCLEGREFNLYFDNVLRITSADGAVMDPRDFLIDVTCAKGEQFGNFWRYTPTGADAGSTTLTVAVYDRTRTTAYASKTATLVTVALAHPAVPVARKLLVIGDSTVAAGKSLAELVNLFDGDSQYALTLVGSNDGNKGDSGSVSRAIACDAVSGWTFNRFATDTTTAWTEINGGARTGSPFVSGGVFNFGAYLTAQSITLTTGDWVIINLGINDVFGSTTDADATAINLTVAGILTGWIASIKAAVSGIRIGICLPIPPAASQDAFGDSYGCGQTRLRYNRNRALLVEDFLRNYDDDVTAGVYVVPINANIDTVNNFPVITAAHNARNSATASRQSNGVHPADSGYFQTADTWRAFLKGVEA